MQQLVLLAGGKFAGTPEGQICQTYLKRISWPIKIIEIKSGADRIERIFQDAMSHAPFWVALDEAGHNITSTQFCEKLSGWMSDHGKIGFMIGIDTGIPENILMKCQYKMALGHMTWPHLLARTMLIEQLYRAQQIMLRHPYHKA